MAPAIPGSLSEGAVERSETEGVYFDERKRSKISEFICADMQTIGPEQPSDDTPSVTPVGRASSLREGAGGGCVPFSVPPGSRKIAGDFHRPYETQKVLHSAIHRGTLPQSVSLTAPSEREPGWGAYHSTCRPETATFRAIFIAPTKTQNVLPPKKSSGF